MSDTYKTTAQDWTLSPDALARFLTRLSPDILEAGKLYERLRSRLVRIFEWRGCTFAEDLSDETINRVIRKIEDGLDLAGADVSRYAAAVASNVHYEWLRGSKREKPGAGDRDRAPYIPGKHETTDFRLDFLERALSELSEQDRALILRYYQIKGPRIQHRRQLAEELGIESNNLRIRAYRIRTRLEQAVAREIDHDHSQRTPANEGVTHA